MPSTVSKPRDRGRSQTAPTICRSILFSSDHAISLVGSGVLNLINWPTIGGKMASSPESQPNTRALDVVQFGIFELNRRAGELRKHGTRIRLQPKPMHLLCALLERPGEIITRDELKARLWPDDTFVDFE